MDAGTTWHKINNNHGQPARITQITADPYDANIFWAVLFGTGFLKIDLSPISPYGGPASPTPTPKPELTPELESDPESDPDTGSENKSTQPPSDGGGGGIAYSLLIMGLLMLLMNSRSRK